nr:MAG TPA: helix-turn-helix domain protein [Caudoviricetes sp.]
MSDCRGVLTAGETAGMLGISEREVYSLCASGVLPHYICFDAAEIEGYLKKVRQ